MDANPATVLASATFIAACDGDAHALAAWLDGGGQVDARCPVGLMWTRDTNTTLLMAYATAGQEAVVRMLLLRGASVNLLMSSNGLSALMLAAGCGHTTIVQALLDAMADASLQAINGGTALMIAEQQKHRHRDSAAAAAVRKATSG